MALDTTLFNAVIDDVNSSLGRSITWAGVELIVPYDLHTDTEKQVGSALGDITIILKKSDVASIDKTVDAVVETKTYSNWMTLENDHLTWTVVGYNQAVT